LNPFFPIESGSVFIGKISVHNLRKAEIGALFQSIKFNNSGFHSIGFAKAYGFGRVKIEIKSTKGFLFSKDEYAMSFRVLMETEIPNYSKSKELKELNVMSSPQITASPLEYMDLEDFVNCKRRNFNKDLTGEYLEYYSDLKVPDLIIQPILENIEAEISFVGKPTVKAKLLDGKDLSSKTLQSYPPKLKLKVGDKILVRKIIIGGSFKELTFIKLIK